MKITAQDRLSWHGRKDTAVYPSSILGTHPHSIWRAEVLVMKSNRWLLPDYDWISVTAKTKALAVNAAIRAERAAKKGKKR